MVPLYILVCDTKCLTVAVTYTFTQRRSDEGKLLTDLNL